MKIQIVMGLFFRIACWCLLALVLAVTGCSGTKAKAPRPMPVAVSPPTDPETGLPLTSTTVLVKGKTVTNPIVRWNENLTVAEAIVASGYHDKFTPHVILLVRRGQVRRIEPQRLLSGKDNPLLEPGDAIDIQQ